MGDAAEAMYYYRKAVTLSPATTHYSLQLAEVYESRGAYEHAVRVLDDLLRLAPESVKAWIKLAHLQEVLEDYESASYSWRKVLEIKREDDTATEALVRLASMNSAKLQGVN